VDVHYAQCRAETPRKAMIDWAFGYNGMHASIHTHTDTDTDTKDYAHKTLV